MKEVSEKYGIELKELIKMINVEVKEVKEIERKTLSKIPMPFTGEMCISNCNGIRVNHGLYTQCTNEYQIEKNGYKLCKTCLKQTEKNSNGKPTYGYIQDRIELGDKYKDPKGKSPIQYGNIMEKLNISRSTFTTHTTAIYKSLGVSNKSKKGLITFLDLKRANF